MRMIAPEASVSTSEGERLVFEHTEDQSNGVADEADDCRGHAGTPAATAAFRARVRSRGRSHI